jgi:hypothetical protein
MSDPEGFLTRWSRRKREADDAAPAAQPAVGEERASLPADQADASESRAGKQATETKATETKATETKATETKAAEVDLSALPPLESITATTDIRAFLLPGVPAELTRAALRRAWVADPAIRDFIGLAENAWDFTAPDTVPGFGSSVPADVARRLIAGMVGEDRAPAPTEEVARAETVTKPDVSATGDAGAEVTTAAGATVMDDAGGAAANRNADVAMHKEEAPEERPKRASPHGGALPR